MVTVAEKRNETARGISFPDLDSLPPIRPEPWEAEGSILIERYVYVGKRGGEGVQWIVYRVRDRHLVHVRSCDTLSRALEVAGATS